MNWRFFPSLDPQVDIMVSRDLDSLISDREAAAVNEWLESDKQIHVMRDHPHHGTVMLGGKIGQTLLIRNMYSNVGMWGSKLMDKSQRDKWKESWSRIQESKSADRQGYDADQQILRQFIWPWAQHDALQHDSYLCHMFPNTIGFPTQRNNTNNNFVGAVVNLDVDGIHNLWKECPRDCRRKGHEDDWLYC